MQCDRQSRLSDRQATALIFLDLFSAGLLTQLHPLVQVIFIYNENNYFLYVHIRN